MYQSEALLEVSKDENTSLERLSNSFNPFSGDKDYLDTQIAILKSRSLAEMLAEAMNLKDSKEFVARTSALGQLTSRISSSGSRESPSDGGLMAAFRQEQLVNSILQRIKVKRHAKGSLIEIGLEATERVFAQQMLQRLIDLFLDQNLRKRRAGRLEAGKWLHQEIESSAQKLQNSARALVDFTNEHGMVSMEEGANHILNFFNKAAEGLVKAKEQRVEAEAFRRDDSGLPGALMPREAKPLDFSGLKEKLSGLESEYAQLSEVYSEHYPKLTMLRKQISFLRAKISDMEQRVVTEAVDTAKRQERSQEDAFEQAKKVAMDNNSLGIHYAILKKEQETNEEIHKLLLSKSKELDLNTRIIANNISVVDPPTLPVRPWRPKRRLIMGISGLLGLLAGVAMTLLMESLDNKPRKISEVERCLGIPTLGIIPDARKAGSRLGANGSTGNVDFIAHDSPRSVIADSIRNIKTSLVLSTIDAPLRSIVVSSAMPSEGKTFVAISIATTLASKEKKVVLVDTDLRRPRVGKAFDPHDRGPGLTSILTDWSLSLSKVIRRSRVPGLYYIPAGPIPPNPAALVESRRMQAFVAELKKHFDYVIFDTPPVTGFSEAVLLASGADAVILVIRAGTVPGEVLAEAAKRISLTGGQLIGAVLNMTNGDFVDYYGKGYSKYRKYYSSS